jgi:hypothetical protein
LKAIFEVKRSSTRTTFISENGSKMGYNHFMIEALRMVLVHLFVCSISTTSTFSLAKSLQKGMAVALGC